MEGKREHNGKINNKRGSYIIEAAVVLPVIILVTITVILIVMFFYHQMTSRCLLHMQIRNEAGLESGQTIYGNREKEIKDIEAEIYTDKGLIGGTVYGKKYLIMGHKGSLDEKGTFLASGKSHIINGPAYVRYSRMVKGINDE